MRRAFLVLPLLLLSAVIAGIAHALPKITIVNRINAIGLVDYHHGAHFKVGDWVRYHVENRGLTSGRSDYDLTLLIAGEEEFWGEKCFWLETWSRDEGGREEAAASLVSYDIFNDSLADERIQIYRRKVISGVDDDNQPIEEITRSNSNLNQIRSGPVRPTGYTVDSLGTDTLSTPLGEFKARRVDIKTAKQLTRTEGDSTVVLETHNDRSRWMVPAIPITSVGREDIRDTRSRKAWKIGYASDAKPPALTDNGTGSARIVAIGHGGLVPKLLPADRAVPFAKPAAHPAGKRKATAKH